MNKDDEAYMSLGQLALSLTKEDIARMSQKAFRYSEKTLCYSVQQHFLVMLSLMISLELKWGAGEHLRKLPPFNSAHTFCASRNDLRKSGFLTAMPAKTYFCAV